jgi:hypothetical protein
MVLARPRAKSTIKIDSKNSLYPHSHFTEHLVGAFGKPTLKSNLNHESSSLLIRRLKNNTDTSTCNNPHKIPHKTRANRTKAVDSETEETELQATEMTSPVAHRSTLDSACALLTSQLNRWRKQSVNRERVQPAAQKPGSKTEAQHWDREQEGQRRKVNLDQRVEKQRDLRSLNPNGKSKWTESRWPWKLLREKSTVSNLEMDKR